MPKLRPETRVERRQLLIDAAWRCAALRGFSDLTVDDVCARSGGQQGRVYGYFEHKQDLLLALLRTTLQRLTASWSGSPARTPRGPADETASRRRCSHAARIRRGCRSAPTSGPISSPSSRCASAWRQQRSGGVCLCVRGSRRRLPPASCLAYSRRSRSRRSARASDGLMLHRALDPNAFRRRNVRQAMDAMFAGIEAS